MKPQHTKPTPGPWEIDTETRPAEICTVHHVPTQPTEDGLGQGWVYIRGAIGYWDADENEQMANARLIAAAPELLETLEEIKRGEENESGKCVGNGWVWNAARRAIAKAKGEQ